VKKVFLLLIAPAGLFSAVVGCIETAPAQPVNIQNRPVPLIYQKTGTTKPPILVDENTVILKDENGKYLTQ
jgi:hypothetical protein